MSWLIGLACHPVFVDDLEALLEEELMALLFDGRHIVAKLIRPEVTGVTSSWSLQDSPEMVVEGPGDCLTRCTVHVSPTENATNIAAIIMIQPLGRLAPGDAAFEEADALPRLRRRAITTSGPQATRHFDIAHLVAEFESMKPSSEQDGAVANLVGAVPADAEKPKGIVTMIDQDIHALPRGALRDILTAGTPIMAYAHAPWPCMEGLWNFSGDSVVFEGLDGALTACWIRRQADNLLQFCMFLLIAPHTQAYPGSVEYEQLCRVPRLHKLRPMRVEGKSGTRFSVVLDQTSAKLLICGDGLHEHPSVGIEVLKNLMLGVVKRDPTIPLPDPTTLSWLWDIKDDWDKLLRDAPKVSLPETSIFNLIDIPLDARVRENPDDTLDLVRRSSKDARVWEPIANFVLRHPQYEEVSKLPRVSPLLSPPPPIPVEVRNRIAQSFQRRGQLKRIPLSEDHYVIPGENGELRILYTQRVPDLQHPGEWISMVMPGPLVSPADPDYPEIDALPRLPTAIEGAGAETATLEPVKSEKPLYRASKRRRQKKKAH